MSIPVVSRPIFQRAMRVISSITNDFPAIVTTTTNHQYITGMIIRLNIPQGYGMQEANQKYGKIIKLSDTTYSIDLDTTYMDPFLSLINLGTTDGSGNLSGTITTNLVPFSIGQSFYVSDDTFLVIANSGTMYSDGNGSGTFNASSGAYTITGSLPSTTVYFTQVTYPFSYQYAQCTPIGVEGSDLSAATQNVLGTRFYN